VSSSRNIDAASSAFRGEGAMTILALYKLLLYGGLALLVGSLVALEVFLNWKYPLPPDLGSSVVPTEASEAQRRDLSCQCFVALAAAQKEIPRLRSR
jgi:hypothetical protein